MHQPGDDDHRGGDDYHQDCRFHRCLPAVEHRAAEVKV
jgi:hypothetical protein